MKVSLTNCNVFSIFVFLKIFHNKSKTKLNKLNIRQHRSELCLLGNHDKEQRVP